MNIPANETRPIVVTGATGKVGSRVAARLDDLDVTVRRGSRSRQPGFDWAAHGTWAPLLYGASAVFVSYYPDVAAAGAADAIGAFTAIAADCGVERVVLLSGRGEPEAARSEQAMKAGGLPWTVLSCSWFAQNFSEHFLLGSVLDGVIALPAPNHVGEPFVDLDDVADVAVSTLTAPGHTGNTYELTGPDTVTFPRVAETLTAALRRPVIFASVSIEEWVARAVAGGVPHLEAQALAQVFATVLDGRNDHATDDIPHILGRPATSFATYVARTVSSGAWASPSREDVDR
jgi:uncharacterized protein YbjT (DUF2867 family)